MTIKRAESDKILVRDFSQKLWLLMLVHDALYTETTSELHRDSHPWIRTDASGDRIDWFKDRVFDGGVKWKRHDTESLHSSVDSLRDDLKGGSRAEDLLHVHVVNRRLGQSLRLFDSYTSENNPGKRAKDNYLTPLFHPCNDNEEACNVPKHVVYRCVRGFHMLPCGFFDHEEEPIQEPSSEGERQFRRGECFCPTNYNFSKYLERFGVGELLKLKSPEDIRVLIESNIDDEAGNRLATLVYYAFCGAESKSDSGKLDPCYGLCYEDFEKFALAYFSPRIEPPEQKYPADLFDTYDPDKRVAEAEPLVIPEEVTGQCAHSWGATYFDLQRQTAKNGEVLALGGWVDLKGEDEQITISQLRITLDTSGAWSPKNVKTVPRETLNEYKGYKINLPRSAPLVAVFEFKSTSDLIGRLETWTPLIQIDTPTEPFEIGFKAESPLSRIKSVQSQAPGANQINSPCDVVHRFLEQIMPSSQREWTPGSMVPIVEHGVFKFGDTDGDRD